MNHILPDFCELWMVSMSWNENGEGDFSLPAWGRERRVHRYPALYMSGQAANRRRIIVSLVRRPPITPKTFNDANTNGPACFFIRRALHNIKNTAVIFQKPLFYDQKFFNLLLSYTPLATIVHVYFPLFELSFKTL